MKYFRIGLVAGTPFGILLSLTFDINDWQFWAFFFAMVWASGYSEYASKASRGAGMTIVRVPGWGLSINDGRYYGWRWCLHVGPWLVFFGQAEGRG
jgi:hypothetical protein